MKLQGLHRRLSLRGLGTEIHEVFRRTGLEKVFTIDQDDGDA